MPYLSVVIPCYNEAANLNRGVLAETAAFLKTQSFSWEVIISDDGSTDESRTLIKKLAPKGYRLLKNQHGGKAFALRHGIQKARGRFILTTDMDQSTPLEEIEKLLPFLENGFPVVIGSRGLSRQGAPWYRKAMSIGFRYLRGFFLLSEIADTQCGFKAYEAKAIKSIFPRLEIFKKNQRSAGWRVSAFDVEILFLAKKMGFKVKEVKVSWRNQDVSQTKRQNFLKESVEMAKEITRVKLNNLKGAYDH